MVIPNLVSFLYSFKNHPVGIPPEGSRFISPVYFYLTNGPGNRRGAVSGSGLGNQ